MDLEQKQLNKEMSFLPPPRPPCFAGDEECKDRVLGFTVEQLRQKPWGVFQGASFGRDEKNECSMVGEELQQGFLAGKDLDSVQSKLCARGHWRPAEDAKLRELVAQYGPQNWNLIAEKLDGRSGKSCRLRWFNQLDPRINRRAFSEEEEERLLAAHRLYGNKWALIARLFPGRTDNAVKNHWHVIMARKQREQSNAYRRRKPSSSMSTLPTEALGRRIEINGSNNNACSGESTITSARDESASTRTDLSLCSSSCRLNIPVLFSRFSPPQQRQPLEFLPGLVEKMGSSLTNGLIQNLGGDNPQQGLYHTTSDGGAGATAAATMGGAGEPSGYSDSNSEASGSESGSNTVVNTKEYGCGGEADHGSRINLPYIDFLGVGAT